MSWKKDLDWLFLLLLVVLVLLLQLWALLTLFFDFCWRAYITKAAPGQAVACKGDIAETAIAPESMINIWPGRLKSSVSSFSYRYSNHIRDCQLFSILCLSILLFCQVTATWPDLPTVNEIKMQRLLVEEFYYLQSFLLYNQQQLNNGRFCCRYYTYATINFIYNNYTK